MYQIELFYSKTQHKFCLVLQLLMISHDLALASCGQFGGLVVATLDFSSSGLRFEPWLGTLLSLQCLSPLKCMHGYR